MKRSVTPLSSSVLAVLALALLTASQPACAQTAFIYNGKLPNAPTGHHDLRFTLFTAPTNGTQVGSPLLLLAIPVTSGNYSVTLDFGADSCADAPLYIQIAYRRSGTTTYKNVNGRVLLTTRFSLLASNTLALQGWPVSDLAPSAGQVLKFDGTQWMPGEDNAGGGGLTLPYVPNFRPK